MSEQEKEAAPRDLREDLACSSSEEEAVDAGGAVETAMEEDKAPPANPEAVTSTATPASTAPKNRQPTEEARKEQVLTYACTQCNYTLTSRANLNTHVRRRHTEAGVHWECGRCWKPYQMKDYLTRHQAASASCRGATAIAVSSAGPVKTPEESSQPSEEKSPKALAKGQAHPAAAGSPEPGSHQQQ